MKYFSYNDYEDYTNNKELSDFFMLEEKKMGYKINETKNELVNIDNLVQNDEIIEKLKDKSEVIRLLYYCFHSKLQIKEDNLKLCKNFIKIQDYEHQKTNQNYILYKIIKEEKYFYFEHISKIDYKIPYKMFNIAMDIIKNWNDGKKENKKYPIVFPIVIYTGKEKWNNESDKNNLKIKYITYKKNSINLSYNIIDYNRMKFNFTK